MKLRWIWLLCAATIVGDIFRVWCAAKGYPWPLGAAYPEDIFIRVMTVFWFTVSVSLFAWTLKDSR